MEKMDRFLLYREVESFLRQIVLCAGDPDEPCYLPRDLFLQTLEQMIDPDDQPQFRRFKERWERNYGQKPLIDFTIQWMNEYHDHILCTHPLIRLIQLNQRWLRIIR